MLSEEALERLSERLVNRIEELNTFMIKKLGNQIVDIGKLTPSQLREVLQSIKYGNNLDEIINKLSEITDKNVKDIYEIFEEVAKMSQEYARQFYEYRKINYIPFDENLALQRQVSAIAKATAEQYQNMSKTFAFARLNENGERYFTDLSQTYQDVIDEAVLSISQGRESYNTVMKRTMQQLCDSGIRTVNYETGYSRRADSSVRMNIMDGVRRLNMELQSQFGEEFDADGVEVSHHKNPAPDHENTIDGKQFSTKGEVEVDGVKFQDFDTVNNSLTRHVGELNCYHFTYQIVLGVSEPLHSKKELEADKKANHDGFEFEGKHYTNYEGTQLQRQLETKIRQYKDKQIGAKSMNDMDEVYRCQEKIGQLTSKYNDLSKVSGLPTKIDRLRVEGYRKVNIKKEISSNFTDITDDWIKSASPNSHKVKELSYFKHDDVKYEVDGKNVLFDYNIREREVAEWLENNLGGELYMVPRVNKPDGISTPDYLFRNEYWDLKEITGNGKNTIDSLLKKQKNQSLNFIIDLSNTKMPVQEAIQQIEKVYKKKDRRWIEKIILKNKDDLIKIYKKRN